MSACGLLLVCLVITLVCAVPTNVTIDDRYGDPVTGFTPVYSNSAYDVWNAGPGCSSCYIQPNPTQCYDNTWHDITVLPSVPSTEYPNFNLTFSGTAIYLFAVIPNTVEVNGTYAVTAANVTFLLNGTYVADFTNWPNTSNIYEYNTPIYTNQSLPLGQHSLQVRLKPGTSGSYLAFDYAIYTIDDGTSTSSSGSASSTTSRSSSNTPATTSPALERASLTGAIVGGTVGGVGGIIVLVLLVICLRRQKRGNTRLSQSGLGHGADPYDSARVEPFREEGTQYQFDTQPLFAGLQPNRRPTTPLRVIQPTHKGSGLQDGSAPSSVLLQSTGSPVSVGGNSQKRHGDLARQVREMEQRAAILNARRAEVPLSATRAEGDGELRMQVETLMVEVGRLKAEQEEQRLLTTEQPPAYEHSPIQDSKHNALPHSAGESGIAV